MLRLSWTQPEDLAAHALAAARHDGLDVHDLEARLVTAGGTLEPIVSGASPTPASADLRREAAEIVDEACARPRPAALLEREPDAWTTMAVPHRAIDVAPGLDDRLRGAWLGRAVGCLMGKPVEKIPREGIRRIAEATGTWPIRGYFTAVGLPDAVAAAYPWNRRSAPTSLVEVIDGMPEDDDLNFPIIALTLLEQHGAALTIEDVARRWLEALPAGRVFTAERIAYRNLLAGIEPEDAAEAGNPLVDWIGALIRADVHGWAHPGHLREAARLAVVDARLTHRRIGVHGAAWIAAATSAAAAGQPAHEAVETGLAVVPKASRLAAAARLGLDLGRSELDDDAVLDAVLEAYGELHWVHTLGNAALIALGAVRGEEDFARGVGIAIAGGLDTDSVGATVGGLLGAAGRSAVPTALAEPLHGVYRTSLAGFDGITFDELAARTLALAEASA